ncbi:hypothetical protein LIG30_2198 [Burkholderia sp. lig30]|nr:hypothetical protein LIG30_2198 [Burkholderia sp. lig30]
MGSPRGHCNGHLTPGRQQPEIIMPNASPPHLSDAALPISKRSAGYFRRTSLMNASKAGLTGSSAVGAKMPLENRHQFFHAVPVGVFAQRPGLTGTGNCLRLLRVGQVVADQFSGLFRA